MENIDKVVVNIYLNDKKKLNFNKTEIITQKTISDFNESINAFFKNKNDYKPIIITKKNLFIFFLYKFKYTRNLNYLLKQKNKIYSKDVSKKIINFFYLYALFYIYIDYEYIKPKLIQLDIFPKIFSTTEFFKLIIKLYKSTLLSFNYITNIFNFNLFLLKNIKNNLPVSQKVNALMEFIKFFWKIFKEKNDRQNDKEINDLIRKEVLSKIFEIINGVQNENNNLVILHTLRKEVNIILLVRMIIESKILSEENKAFIETNIIKFFKNNFRKEHLNYFYKITSKILIKFNNLNIKGIKYTKDKDDYLSLNKDFLFLTKMTEILTKVANEEKNQIKDNSCYYCDKGFVFNIEDKDKIGFKVKDIVYNYNKKNNLCILFSFLLKKNKNKDYNQIIFSINDSDYKEYICLFVKKQNLYLRYVSKKLNEIKILDNINYDYYYSFLFLYDKNKIKIYINNNKNENISQKDTDFKLPSKFQVNIGCPEGNKNQKNPEFSFNGIIFPILIFELNGKSDFDSEIRDYLIKIKNNYYLIGEKYFNQDEQEKSKKKINEDNVVINYEQYYGLYDELENEIYTKNILNHISNLILYINPYVVISSFIKKATIYKDYNYYEIPEKTSKLQYSYEFNIVPSLDNGLLFPFKDNNIISFFKINNGLNLIILEIELIYNYLLLLYNNNNFMALVNENKKELYTLM